MADVNAVANSLQAHLSDPYLFGPTPRPTVVLPSIFGPDKNIVTPAGAPSPFAAALKKAVVSTFFPTASGAAASVSGGQAVKAEAVKVSDAVTGMGTYLKWGLFIGVILAALYIINSVKSGFKAAVV